MLAIGVEGEGFGVGAAWQRLLQRVVLEVENLDAVVVAGTNEESIPVLGEHDAARPLTDGHSSDELETVGIEDRDRIRLLVGDEDGARLRRPAGQQQESGGGDQKLAQTAARHDRPHASFNRDGVAIAALRHAASSLLRAIGEIFVGDREGIRTPRFHLYISNRADAARLVGKLYIIAARFDILYR